MKTVQETLDLFGYHGGDKEPYTLKLDPVGSTVRYEMMKLCTGSVKDTMRQ